MRASGPVVFNLEITLADLRSTGNFGRLRRTTVGKVAIRKRKLYTLRLDNERKVGSRGLAAGIRARNIEGRNTRLGRNTRECQTARSTGELEPVREPCLIPRVLVRSLASRGPGNRGEVSTVRARRRQQVTIEYEGVPGHNRDGDMITVCLLHSTKVALRDAAEVLAGLFVIEIFEGKHLPRLALERNGLAIHHAEPLVRKLNLGGRARGRGGMIGDILPRLSSNREHCRIALVGAHVLRLRDHTRHVRLRKLERDLLRRGDIAQRDLVRAALVIRNVEVNCRIRAGLRNRHALEVAPLVGRRRKGRIPALNNRNRSIVDRTVNRLRRHLVALGFLLDRQCAGGDRDIEVRIGDRRVDLVLTRRRLLIRRAEVRDLYVRGIATAHQARGKLGILLTLKALGIVDLHQQLSRCNGNRQLNVFGGKIVSRCLGMGDNMRRTGGLHRRAASLNRDRIRIGIRID